MAPRHYGAAWHSEDVAAVVGVSVKAFLQDPLVAPTRPRSFSLDRDVMLGDPLLQVELLIFSAAGMDVKTPRLLWLHGRDFFELLSADRGQVVGNLEDLRRAVWSLREVVALLGNRAVELGYACCVLGRRVYLDRII